MNTFGLGPEHAGAAFQLRTGRSLLDGLGEPFFSEISKPVVFGVGLALGAIAFHLLMDR